MKFRMKNILAFIIAFSVILQGLIIPAQAAGIDPYDTFITSQYDDFQVGYNGKGAPPNKTSTGVHNLRDGAWVVFKNMDFGENGPYMVELGSSTPEGYAEFVELRIDSPTGLLMGTVPITPSSGWGVNVTNQALISEKVTGVHDLYICVPNSTVDLESMLFFTKTSKKFEYNIYSKESTFTDVTYDNLSMALDLLTQLGIIEKSESGVYNPEFPASRGEFAQAVYRLCVEKPEEDPVAELMGQSNTAALNITFGDVDKNADYAEAVSYLAEKGYMNGVSEAEFKPNSYITYIDALTVLVRVLGFKQLAEDAGGYPNGYIKMATKEKLTLSGTLTEEYLKRDDMAFLLEKAIDAQYLDAESFYADGYTNYTKKEGIMSLTQDTHKRSGRILATPTTTLDMPGSDLDYNQVTIDDETYFIGDTKATSMIGMAVDYWYKDVKGTKTLRAVIPQNGTEIIPLSSAKNEILKISKSEILYTESNPDNEESFSLKDTAIIYNGVAADAAIDKIINNPDEFKGFITLIENPDNTRTVLIEEYLDIEIESVDFATGKITARKVGAETSKPLFYADASKNYVLIKDQLGEDITIKKLKAGDFLTVYQSNNIADGSTDDKGLVRIFTSVDFVEGTIDKLDAEGNLYIDGKKYVFSNRYTGSKDVGVQKKFYLNIYGDVIKSEALSGIPRVGLFFGKSATETGFDTDIKIKVITTEGRTEIYPLTERVMIDGVKAASGRDAAAALDGLAYETPLRYKVNSAGEISMIDLPNTSTNDADYNDENNKLRKLSDPYGGGFYYHFKSALVTTDRPRKLMYYCPITATVFAFHTEKDASLQARENGCFTGTLANTGIYTTSNPFKAVYSTEGRATAADLVMTDITSSAISGDELLWVFEGLSTKIDANGDIVETIYGTSSVGRVEYILTDEYMSNTDNYNNIKNSLKPGDIIATKNRSGNVLAIIRLCLRADGSSEPRGTLNPRIHKELKEVNIDSYSDYSFAYLYGKVTEKTGDYAMLDTNGDNVGDHIIPLLDKSVTEVYEGNGLFVKSGQSSAIVEVGDTILTKFTQNSFLDIMVLRTADMKL